MTNQDLISVLKELPQDVQIIPAGEEEDSSGNSRVILSAKTLKDFRRLALLYGTEVQINANSFPRVSGGEWIVCRFRTEDERLCVRWCGTVSGYEVRWFEEGGEGRINYFQKLEDAQMVFKELLEEDYDGVILLPGVSGDE